MIAIINNPQTRYRTACFNPSSRIGSMTVSRSEEAAWGGVLEEAFQFQLCGYHFRFRISVLPLRPYRKGFTLFLYPLQQHRCRLVFPVLPSSEFCVSGHELATKCFG